MPTITSTPKETNSNSYISSADADLYFAGKYSSAEKWTGLTAEKKSQLLITATIQLETYLYGGEPTTNTQALQWPRKHLTDRSGNLINQDVIPVKVQYAQCEMADWILTEEDRSLTDIELQQLESFKAGPLDIKVKSAPVTVPPTVKQLLSSIGPAVLVSTDQSVNQSINISR